MLVGFFGLASGVMGGFELGLLAGRCERLVQGGVALGANG